MNTHQANYTKLLEKEYPDSDSSSTTDEDSIHHDRHPILSSNPTKKILFSAFLITITLSYAMISTVFMMVMYYNGTYTFRAPSPPYSPANDVIRYMTVNSADGYDEHMQGFPSEAHDKAWLELVSPALSRISYEEMKTGYEDPEHSVAIGDGKGGYMVSLGVYHELHCLRRLKLYLHKEHYYPKLMHGSEEDVYELGHLNHCLEAIRLSLMCAGNTALYSFQWPGSNEKVRKPRTKTNSQRICVDWSLVEQWAQNRSIGMDPVLERPEVEE